MSKKTPFSYGCDWRTEFRLAIVFLAVIVLLLGLGAGRSHGANPSKFCGSPVIRDYEVPLHSLAPVEPLPKAGKLPFGPSSVRANELYIAPPQRQRLAYLGASGALQIENTGLRPAVLNWTVSVRLSQVSPGGRLIQFSEASQSIDTLAPGQRIQVAGEKRSMLGSYRADFTFVDSAGRLLAAYSDYFRVVRPHLRVRLGLSRRSIFSSGQVWARIENIGTQLVTYGHELTVQRFNGGRWSDLPQEPVLQPAFGLGGGMAGRCMYVELPNPARPGRYRVQMTVSTLYPKRKRLPITAYFRVKSPHSADEP
jgi:hypothetical protein